jgi:hypothetical protein
MKIINKYLGSVLVIILLILTIVVIEIGEINISANSVMQQGVVVEKMGISKFIFISKFAEIIKSYPSPVTDGIYPTAIQYNMAIDRILNGDVLSNEISVIRSVCLDAIKVMLLSPDGSNFEVPKMSYFIGGGFPNVRDVNNSRIGMNGVWGRNNRDTKISSVFVSRCAFIYAGVPYARENNQAGKPYKPPLGKSILLFLRHSFPLWFNDVIEGLCPYFCAFFICVGLDKLLFCRPLKRWKRFFIV